MTHSQRDARSIEAWFEADPGTEIPESSESASVLAHENQSAWAHVDPLKLRGLSTMEAQAHMVTMARLATRHGTHNQKSHGNKKGGGAPRTKLKCCGSVKQIESDVYAGRPTVARPEQVAALMEDFKDGPSTNLGVLTIAGQECCFQNHHPAEIPRSEMPQLPTTVEGLQHFVDELGKRGIKATIEQVDPSTLTATQNELDAKKVAKLYGFMKPPGGWQEGGALLISNDNFVVDGHHRWAGAAAVAAGGDPIKVTAIRIDMPIDDALALAQEFSGERFGLGQGVQV